MKTIKTSYYLIPVVLSALVVAGLLYYFFLTDFAEEKETVGYVYIDEDDNVDSVFAKLQPSGTQPIKKRYVLDATLLNLASAY